MKESLDEILLLLFGAQEVKEVEVIQTLWSGYGKISRFELVGSDIQTVIAKKIILPSESKHPRGWNTNRSHQRKIKSYEVEVEWYEKWAHQSNDNCRVPKCYSAISDGDEHIIVLEDLDAAGFPIRKSSLDKQGVKLGLKWLANFHATFLNQAPTNLWKEGTYWHLNTRPDEFEVMKEGKLKSMAVTLDEKLSNCKFQTIIHGDAKVANFCFSADMKLIAAVDFQYVGGGCGMKDVVYFLGSCLEEAKCEKFEIELLNYYFNELKNALEEKGQAIDFSSIEKEWRSMYPIAWTDFSRFLMGWMPTHPKLNNYSLKLIERVII